MSYYLGIDIGTSGTKAIVMDARAKVLGSGTSEYAVSTPAPNWSEQDPDQWWTGTVRATRTVIRKTKIDPRQIAAIGLSGQMHGLVITDGAGKPLRASIIWNDQRTAREAGEIERKVGGKRKLISLVGNPAMTSYTLTKLLWVRRNEPRIYERIKHLLLPKDYVRLRLTGEYVGEVSDMSGTLMLDQRTRNWSRKMLDIFHIDRDILPPVVESHKVTGRLTRSAARRLALAEGIPVVGGGGDQPAGAVGNGVVTDGMTSATMGTSGVVLVHSKQYKSDPQGRVNTYCASVPGEYCMFGCVLSAGGSLQWYRNVLAGEEVAEAKRKSLDPYAILDARAEKVPAGCEGLFWLPFLTGERTPHADPHARGCWIGIDARTDRAHMVRSVMEGATFAMNDVVRLLIERGIRIRQIRLSGGGAKSTFWRQLQADVYGLPCATINSDEGPAYGAGLLAAVGTGRFKDVREAARVGIKVTRTIKPNTKNKRLYARYYDQYRRLYPTLKEEFARIAGLVGTR